MGLTDRLYQFSEIDQFLKHYSPLSPYGKTNKSETLFFTEVKPLNQIYDLIQNMTGFVKTFPEKTDKIEYHLSRIPQLSDLINLGNIRSELFNVKKFLHNYREISLLLQSEKSNVFEFEFKSETLLKLLGHGEDQEENFYLKDSYSPGLRHIRKEIRTVDIELTSIREVRIEQIRDNLELDFRFHDFLVIKECEMPANTDSFIYREPYDKHFILVKPVWGQDYYDKHNSRKELLQKEGELESEILNILKKKISAEKSIINAYIKELTSFDTILAKTKLAIKYQCVRPQIKAGDSIFFQELAFIPLKVKCEEFNRKYTPLSANFLKRNIVITGSNMGGKTVLLKSIAFCQLLVQMGFFIPAKKVHTTLFDSLNLIGNNVKSSLNGLSSFGEEVMNLIEADLSDRSLLFFDEFAKTTNSIESYALNSALLEWFSDQSSLYSFSSTHLDNLPGLKNVSYWTMKGLDYKKYSQYYHKHYNGDLIERINLINEFMDYGVEPQQDSDSRKDALKIADILGLNSAILNNAKKYIKKQEINNG